MSEDQQPQRQPFQFRKPFTDYMKAIPQPESPKGATEGKTATPPPFVVIRPDPPNLHGKSRGGIIFWVIGAMVLVAFFFATLVAGLGSNQRSILSTAPRQIAGKLTTIVPTVVTYKPMLRPTFERGIATPRWQPTGYSASDTLWQQDLGAIGSIGATSIEMPVLLHFTHVGNAFTFVSSAPTLVSTEAGIQAAHAAGFLVFLTPLVQIDGQKPDSWVGHLVLPTLAAQMAWFAAYWTAWQPYVVMAQKEHVEQMACATEWSWLAYNVPPFMWNSLIANINARYTGKLSYDMNWGEAFSASGRLPTWELNGRLFALGISEYMPLEGAPLRIDPASLTGLWHARIQPMLDNVARLAERPVFLSEVGYRDRVDALFQSWRSTNNNGMLLDPTEQEAAINAALTNVFADPHVIGCFFWGWRDTGEFDLVGHPQALATIQEWYTK